MEGPTPHPPASSGSTQARASPNKANRQVAPPVESGVEDILGDLDDLDLDDVDDIDAVVSTSVPAQVSKVAPPKPQHEFVGEEIMTEETLDEGTMTGHAREINQPEAVKQGFGGGIDLPPETQGGAAEVEMLEAVEAGVETIGIATMAAGEAGDEWDMTENALGQIDSEAAVAKKQHEVEAEAAVVALSGATGQQAVPSFQGIPDLSAKLDLLFKSVDSDGSGTIERNEIKKLVVALGLASGKHEHHSRT
jgi:hypothetical protein